VKAKKMLCFTALCATLMLLSGLTVAQESHARSAVVAAPMDLSVNHHNTPGIPNYCHPCLFYGGDIDTTQSNAGGLYTGTTLVNTGTPYGSATFANFVVPKGKTWTVTGLFINNFNTIGMTKIDPMTSYWEIRTKIPKAGGSGGTLVAKGTNKATFVATGNVGGIEFTDMVKGLKYKNKAITLTGGTKGTTYWMAVIPPCTKASDTQCQLTTNTGSPGYAESNSEHNPPTNATRPYELVQGGFFNSSHFSAKWDTMTQAGCGPGAAIGCDRWSAGVIGTSK
jgi:hypothetical protein